MAHRHHFEHGFYHVTLCISAVFAVTCVRPSVCHMYCIQMAEDIVKLIS